MSNENRKKNEKICYSALPRITEASVNKVKTNLDLIWKRNKSIVDFVDNDIRLYIQHQSHIVKNDFFNISSYEISRESNNVDGYS